MAGIAALAQAYRLTGWGSLRSFKEPIVWVLHLAYLWLPVGLALKALHLATGVVWASAWLHALAMGAAATMIVAVITRAALGHTGRPLVVSRSVAIAYVVLGLASLLRALAPALPDFSEWTIQTDIEKGRQVWQSMGGMQIGSIWGHGGYVAPDWSADWLHREATAILDGWARKEYRMPNTAAR